MWQLLSLCQGPLMNSVWHPRLLLFQISPTQPGGKEKEERKCVFNRSWTSKVRASVVSLKGPEWCKSYCKN